MRKAALILLSVFLACFAFPARAQEPGSDAGTERYAVLDSLLSDYYFSLLGESHEVICGECDFLISSCRDSLTRQHVAVGIFNHYCEAPVMGDEAVALYVYDNWFATGRIRMPGDWEDFQAGLFAEFNRLSMLYMPAPELSLYSPYGQTVTLPCEGQFALYFFYDTSCPKCKAESLLFSEALSSYSFRIWLYAVYVGTDEDSWADFRSTFRIDNPYVEVVHLWDPDISSDYQRKYAVTTTPRLFAISPDCTIIGRRLEMDSMKQLLNIYNNYLGYGQ